MLYVTIVFLHILVRHGEGTIPPRLEITSAHLTPNGVTLKWEVDLTAVFDKFVVTYSGNDNSFEHVEVLGTQKEVLLELVRPCVEYTAQVQGFSGDSGLDTSPPYPFSGWELPEPHPPQNLSVEMGPEGRVLHWDPPADSDNIRNYNIIWRQIGDNEQRLQVAFDKQSYTLSQLQYKWDYLIWMTSSNLCNESKPSGAVTVNSLKVPNPPIISSVVPGEKSFAINFQPDPMGSTVDSFKLSYGEIGKEMTSELLDSSNTRKEIKVNNECVIYAIELYAVNIAGTSEAAKTYGFASSSKILTKPDNPTLVEERNGFTLTWTYKPTGTVLAYSVEYYTSSGRLYTVTVAADKTSVHVRQLSSCQNYTVHVRALENCGWSEYSEGLLFLSAPHDIPQTPANLKTNGNEHLLTIFWDKGNTDELRQQYELATAESLGASRFYWVPPEADQYVLQHLGKYTEYRIQLSAKNACGWSMPAEIVVSFS